MTDDENRALAIARRHGLRAERAELLPGVMNVVTRIRTAEGADAVVRFPVDPARPDEFGTEEWAYAAAASAGIPSPRVIARGSDEGMPYLVLEYIDPQADALPDPWRLLGTYAAAIARIPVGPDAPAALFSRFGRDLALAWREHVAYNLVSLTEDDGLIALGVYKAGHRERLRHILESLDDAPFRFGLSHGDLAPRNLIARAGGAVLIDWGAASTGPVPWTDVQRVYQWAVEDGVVTPAEFQSFARAAGIDPEADEWMLDALTALRHLDLVRWALAQQPDSVVQYADSARKGLARILRGSRS